MPEPVPDRMAIISQTTKQLSELTLRVFAVRQPQGTMYF